jgi:hypothetical protein
LPEQSVNVGCGTAIKHNQSTRRFDSFVSGSPLFDQQLTHAGKANAGGTMDTTDSNELVLSPAAKAKRPLKVNLRTVTSARGNYDVLTLRVGMHVRFASNFYHDTWHILAGCVGASTLARLMWALSFDRRSNVVMFIDGDHIVTNPFDGMRAMPIAICNGDQTFVDDKVIESIKTMRASKRASDKTVGLLTHGFLVAEQQTAEAKQHWRSDPITFRSADKLWQREFIRVCNGVLVYGSPALVLRNRAVSIATMAHSLWGSMVTSVGGRSTYLSLADRRGQLRPDGEVQVFSQFEDMVAAAGAVNIARDDGSRFATAVERRYRQRMAQRKPRRSARRTADWTDSTQW